jgi:uncharacterized protein (TIGR02118 family)
VVDFVYEITCTGDLSHGAPVTTWVERHAASAWTALPGLAAVDLYEPIHGGTHDPFVDDGAGPLLMAMLHFPTVDKLNAALSHGKLEQSLTLKPNGVAVSGTAFERRFFPVAGAAEAGPLSAPFSYVVRYHHPAENVAEFVSHYLADHPPILAKLPAIRSVLCYLPVDCAAPAFLPALDYMLGNEVVFDSPEAFNAAMASPVRHELRAHFKSFPPFTGRNTHYPMRRRRLRAAAV